MAQRAGSGRRITHVELLYRPGERALAGKVFALLGCEPVDRGGQFFTSLVDPAAPRDYVENVLYASEVRPEQWEFEQALVARLGDDRVSFIAATRRSPQHSTHFGFRVPDESSLAAIVTRVERAGHDDPELMGRVGVDGVFQPGDPGAIAPNMVQAFVWTDVVAAGLLALGQHIEVQWHVPARA